MLAIQITEATSMCLVWCEWSRKCLIYVLIYILISKKGIEVSSTKIGLKSHLATYSLLF